MTDEYAPWFDVHHPMNQVTRRRPTLDELEGLLKSDEDVALTILPNGEVVASAEGVDTGGRKPLTMRENPGGEYAAV